MPEYVILRTTDAGRTYAAAVVTWDEYGIRRRYGGSADGAQSCRRRSAAEASGVRFKLKGETKRPFLSIR
jgi:hypothetical protein